MGKPLRKLVGLHRGACIGFDMWLYGYWILDIGYGLSDIGHLIYAIVCWIPDIYCRLLETLYSIGYLMV